MAKAKTEKEIAFLHGLYVENEWTPKFSAIFDESFKPAKEETVVYINAGAGDHALVLREKLKENTQLFAVCETLELQKIAQAKAEAIKADIDFSTNLPYAESIWWWLIPVWLSLPTWQNTWRKRSSLRKRRSLFL